MFNDIKDILPQTIKRAGIKKAVELYQVKAIFYSSVSKYLLPEFAKKIKLVIFKDNIITSASLSSEATAEMKLNLEKILSNINDKTGDGTVKEIKILT